MGYTLKLGIKLPVYIEPLEERRTFLECPPWLGQVSQRFFLKIQPSEVLKSTMAAENKIKYLLSICVVTNISE